MWACVLKRLCSRIAHHVTYTWSPCGRACFKKNSSLHILAKNSPFYLSKNLMPLLFSYCPFLDHILPFPLLQMMTPISYPSIHTRNTVFHISTPSFRNNKVILHTPFIYS